MLCLNRKQVNLCVLFLMVSPLGWAAGSVTPDNIEKVRLDTEKWIEIRNLIAREKQDWALGKEMLNERIELVEREIASLREKIGEAEQSISDADKKRVELVDQNEKLKGASEKLAEIVSELESQTIALNKRLPDPISERIKPLSQSLPENPKETKLSLAQRFQNVIGIINAVDKFNREINRTSEVRTLADGQVAEVTAIYVGLGQAYYIGANGSVAGVGLPGQDGWDWKPADDASAQIADVVSILKNEKVACFVPLPITIK